MLTLETQVIDVAAHKRIVKKAGSAVELFVERTFLKTTTAMGDPVRACLFRDPRPLSSGKTAWNCF